MHLQTHKSLNRVIALIMINCVLCWTVRSQQFRNKSVHLKKLSENEIDPNVSPISAEVTNTDIISDSTESNVNVDDANPVNKFCKCAETFCNCCRDFQFPLLPVSGPACANIRYLGQEKMSVTLKYGDLTLGTRTISGKSAEPVCIPLPGGFSQFCGRIYGILKEKQDFKACLGLELRAEQDVEAALRVSCFKFGSKGLAVTEAEPLPPLDEKKEDDDDGILYFGDYEDEDDDEIESAEDVDVNVPESNESGNNEPGLLGSNFFSSIFK